LTEAVCPGGGDKRVDDGGTKGWGSPAAIGWGGGWVKGTSIGTVAWNPSVGVDRDSINKMIPSMPKRTQKRIFFIILVSLLLKVQRRFAKMATAAAATTKKLIIITLIFPVDVAKEPTEFPEASVNPIKTFGRCSKYWKRWETSVS
jgi:hypothetical protein